jgi:hypothetical protein
MLSVRDFTRDVALRGAVKGRDVRVSFKRGGTSFARLERGVRRLELLLRGDNLRLGGATRLHRADSLNSTECSRAVVPWSLRNGRRWELNLRSRVHVRSRRRLRVSPIHPRKRNVDIVPLCV